MGREGVRRISRNQILSKYRCLAVAMDACPLQSSSGLLSCAALRGCCGNGWQQLCDQAAPKESPLLGAGWGSPCCGVCELDAASRWATGRGMDRGWGLNGVGGSSQWLWGHNMRGLGAGWGVPSCSSRLPQGFIKFSRSHPSPASSGPFSSPPLK